MTKLPDNETLLRFYREGLSDKEIATAYDVTVSAVNLRFTKLGIERKPWSNTATAIMEAAWPSAEFRRSRFTNYNRARDLYSFMRWQLGDPTLSERQLHNAKLFAKYVRDHDVVLTLDLDLEQQSPWVWVPREGQDGRLVLRWPEGREMPRGPHMAALTLPGDAPRI
nr:hypothetical protein OG781_13150 [Streptomyces sp. NBC_00830]